jgi:general transcription factor IIIA
MCTECAQSFRKHGTLQAHITTVHEGKKRFICVQHDDGGKECGKGFDTVGKLKTHEGRVHAGKRFWCSICIPQEHAEVSGPDHIEQEPGFSTYAGLQEHIKIEHPPTCAECGLQCSTPATLKSHLEIQHGVLGLDERRTHACPEPGCGRGFTKKGNLEIHLRLVHGNMSFVCGEIDLSSLKNLGDWKGENACGQALSTKANLVEHIRTIHMGLDHSRKGKNKPKVGNSKGGPSNKKGAFALTRLTGSGYGDETGRNIACILPDCNFRFLRDYDLEIHLETSHGLPYHEVQDLMLERKNLIYPTWEGSFIYATAEDLEADRALDAQSDPNFGFDADMTLENEARQGGDFWLGGQLTDTVNGEDDWLHDEMEMDQLIAGDYRMDRAEDGEDIAMLDPALR